MAKVNEPAEPEKGVQPSQGGRGLDQGGPRTEAEKKKLESEQVAQKRKDNAGSNAGPDANLPPKYTLTPEEEQKRNKKLHPYTVGEVGEKGQHIRGVHMKAGQEVWLTPEEGAAFQRGGVPLIKVVDEDHPQEQP